MLDGLLQTTTSPDFGRGVDKSLSGYSISQLSSQTQTMLRPVYASLRSQYAVLGELVRAWTLKCFPGGYDVQSLAEERRGKDGSLLRSREMLSYGESVVTGGRIDVEIDEGVPQDEWAERMSLKELADAGFIARRHAMEKMGVGGRSCSGGGDRGAGAVAAAADQSGGDRFAGVEASWAA